MGRNISVMQEPSLGNRYEKRYVIVDRDTGEVIDNAQGYGYKTPQKAHAAWAYKNRDKSKDAEKKRKTKQIVGWLKEHKDFEEMMTTLCFEIECRRSWGPDDKFNTAFVREMLKDWGFSEEELGFSAGELLKCWRKL